MSADFDKDSGFDLGNDQIQEHVAYLKELR